MSFCGADINSLFPEITSARRSERRSTLREKIQSKNFTAEAEADAEAEIEDPPSTKADLYKPQGTYQNFDNTYEPQAEYRLTTRDKDIMDYSTDEEEHAIRRKGADKKETGDSSSATSVKSFIYAVKKLLNAVVQIGLKEHEEIKALLDEYSYKAEKLIGCTDGEKELCEQELAVLEEKIEAIVSNLAQSDQASDEESSDDEDEQN